MVIFEHLYLKSFTGEVIFLFHFWIEQNILNKCAEFYKNAMKMKILPETSTWP